MSRFITLICTASAMLGGAMTMFIYGMADGQETMVPTTVGFVLLGSGIIIGRLGLKAEITG